MLKKKVKLMAKKDYYDVASAALLYSFYDSISISNSSCIRLKNCSDAFEKT